MVAPLSSSILPFYPLGAPLLMPPAGAFGVPQEQVGPQMAMRFAEERSLEAIVQLLPLLSPEGRRVARAALDLADQGQM